MLNSAQTRGFFEGDGGIQVRIDPLANGNISFRVIAKFGQKTTNNEILNLVCVFFNSTKTITTATTQTSTGQTSNSTVEFNFNSAEGSQFIDMYKKDKPLNPGTFKDFLIALLIYDSFTNKTLPLPVQSLDFLNKKTAEEQAKLLQLTLLWLRYQRPAQRIAGADAELETSSVCKKGKPKNIEYWYKYCKATPIEIKESEKYGKELLKPIEDQYNKLVEDLNTDRIKIDRNYVAYYHVADGCLMFDVNIRQDNKLPTIKISPSWSIADDIMAIPLLNAIKRQFGFTTKLTTSGNSAFIRVYGWDNTKNITLPFFQGVVLPSFRQSQFNTFKAVCQLYFNNTYKLSASNFRNFVKEAYFLNQLAGKRNAKTFEKIRLAVEDYIKRNNLL